jgi:hypothetical protein
MIVSGGLFPGAFRENLALRGGVDGILQGYAVLFKILVRSIE